MFFKPFLKGPCRFPYVSSSHSNPYVIIGHKKDKNWCILHVVEHIIGAVGKEVSRDNFKVIESKVNIGRFWDLLQLSQLWWSSG